MPKPSVKQKETLGFPKVLPLLPTSDSILLPRSEIQLPVSDFHHLTTLAETIKKDRYVGVVQIRQTRPPSRCAPVFPCGCLGRILAVQDPEEGSMFFTVRGLCRFDIVQELPETFPCRKAVVSYDKYTRDLAQEADFTLDRTRLLEALRRYCTRFSLEPDWHELAEASNEKLLTMLMMVCPFSASEKQTLLETVSYAAQSELMTSFMEMNALQPVSEVMH